MNPTFNFQEVFAIGLEIEKNGNAFYEKAAAKSGHPGVSKLFNELAAWEKEHISVFTRLLDKAAEASPAVEAYEPFGDAQAYLAALAGGHIFLSNVDIDAVVAKCATPQQALSTALQFEKDSVVLYLSIASLVPPSLGREHITRLSDEELKHVHILLNQIAKLN